MKCNSINQPLLNSAFLCHQISYKIHLKALYSEFTKVNLYSGHASPKALINLSTVV